MFISCSHSFPASPETSQLLYISFCGIKNPLKLRVLPYMFSKFSNKNIEIIKNIKIISWVNLTDRDELTNEKFF